jgi:hypothetical protein
MTPTPEHLDTDFHRERDADSFQVVYLVKRPGYEFVFCIPTTRAAYLSNEQAFFQIRFRDWPPGQACVLELKVLEDFYESLSCLMEYLHIERQESRKPYQVKQQHDASPIRG